MGPFFFNHLVSVCPATYFQGYHRALKILKRLKFESPDFIAIIARYTRDQSGRVSRLGEEGVQIQVKRGSATTIMTYSQVPSAIYSF